MKDDNSQFDTDLQKRGRGRPRLGDTTKYQPAPQIERNKRVTKELVKQMNEESNSIDTI